MGKDNRLVGDHPLYKTALCVHWAKRGTCSFGRECHFAHGQQELRERPASARLGPMGQLASKHSQALAAEAAQGVAAVHEPEQAAEYSSGGDDYYPSQGTNSGLEQYPPRTFGKRGRSHAPAAKRREEKEDYPPHFSKSRGGRGGRHPSRGGGSGGRHHVPHGPYEGPGHPAGRAAGGPPPPLSPPLLAPSLADSEDAGWEQGRSETTYAARAGGGHGGGGCCAPDQAGPAQGGSGWEPAPAGRSMRLSEAALGLMREHKLRTCVNTLLEMGFSAGSAEQAAAAAGGEVPRAVQLLTEGGTVAGWRWVSMAPQPVDVTREAQALLARARALGFSGEEAEMELVMSQGNWEAAAEELEARRAVQLSASAARASAASANHFGQQGTHPAPHHPPAHSGNASAAGWEAATAGSTLRNAGGTAAQVYPAPPPLAPAAWNKAPGATEQLQPQPPQQPGGQGAGQGGPGEEEELHELLDLLLAS